MATPVALTIAGSDPSGGAGIQADLKTFHQFGVYGEAAITLITVQNSCGVERIEYLAADLVAAQIRAVIADIPPAAAKTGALGTRAVIEAVAELAEGFPFPLVVDPVLVSKNGAALLAPDALDALKTCLLPHAFLLTPNLQEAAILSGLPVCDLRDMQAAAEQLASLGPKAVLVKGGHLSEEPVDVLFSEGRWLEFRAPRIATRHTHGTGCTFSAAITALLAAENDLESAVGKAKQFVTAAIRTAPGLGHGAGPVNHHSDG
jgi:hydroxymethylpyrimidine/phosphomethylpyrimidine kinase